MQHLDISISSSSCICEALLVSQYIGKIGGGTPENKYAINAMPAIADYVKYFIPI